MGLFDSIFKSVVRKAVGDVVDKAINEALGNNNVTTTNNTQQFTQPQQVQQPENITLKNDNIETETFENYILSVASGDEVTISFEKSPKLFECKSNAMEISIYFLLANRQEETFERNADEYLPGLYFGEDELAEYPNLMKDISRMVTYNVVDHPVIKQKITYDYHHPKTQYVREYSTHCVVYKFFLNSEDEAKGYYTTITLSIPSECSIETTAYALQAAEKVAATLRIK